MKRLLRILAIHLVLFGLCVPGRAATWPAIPAEVWALNSGGKGAVVVDKWIRYGVRSTEARLRIRIFGEEGLGAAVMPAFDRAWTLEGRTVQRNGAETPFNDAKDLVNGSLQAGNHQLKAKTLVPPGLTADCVVDLHWELGSYFRWDWVELPIQEDYPISRLTMELPRAPWLNYNLMCPPEIHYLRLQKGNYEEFSFADVPPGPHEPFSLSGPFTARFNCYSTYLAKLGPATPAEVDQFWQEHAAGMLDLTYGKSLATGSRYREWSKDLRAGLAGDPPAQAREIYLRLGERIRNMSALGEAGQAALTLKEAKERFDPLDLEASVKRAETSALGMRFLFFQLLLDQGLEPRLLFVADREKRSFSYEFRHIGQFTEVLVGVAGGDGALVWFCPGRRFCPGGVVPAEYQLTQGLLVNLKDKSAKAFSVPAQEPAVNVRRVEFDLGLEDDETFRMRAAFSGIPEYDARRRYGFLPPEEQGRVLKELLEKSARNPTLTRTVVEHAADLRQGLSLVAEGSLALEGGRRRAFPPFPGLWLPLALPKSWPARRNLPIVLPCRQQFSAVARFKLPEGWKLADEPDFVRENPFGQVTWQVRPQAGADRAYEVSFTLTVKTAFAGPSAYVPLREFLGWMETAALRTLTLERP